MTNPTPIHAVDSSSEIPELRRALSLALAETLSGRLPEPLELVPLPVRATVTDSPAKFTARTRTGETIGFLACSAAEAPGFVARAIFRSREAKALLPPPLREVILDPIAEGTVFDRSFALLPYAPPFPPIFSIRALRRLHPGRQVLSWLRKAAAHSRSAALDARAAEQGFAVPLAAIAGDSRLSPSLRQAAGQALDRLGQGKWLPRYVLEHGDLWSGNILRRPGSVRAGYGFVLIDWAGAMVQGYAVYDLVRLTESLGLRHRQFRQELRAHARCLDCEEWDLTGYLLSALGWLALHLERFPRHRFEPLAESCFRTLASAQARSS